MDSLTDLIYILKNELSQVDNMIIDAAQNSGEDVVDDVIAHIATAGGKRIRPLMTLAFAKLFGYDGINHILLAAAVEFIHTATLLHDDVVDESLTRRGIRTANDIWGNKISVLVGDYLFSQSFKMMVKTGSIEALSLLAESSSSISRSEVRQLQIIGNTNITRADYLKLITEKTAMLFATACKVGAIVAGASQHEAQDIYEYGLNFGITFQIMDDYLDYFGIDTNTGKKIGGDFYEGKITAPVLLLLIGVNDDERIYLNRVFSAEATKTELDLVKVTEMMYRYSIQDKVKAFARVYSEMGKKNIERFQQNDIAKNLLKLLDESIDRAK